MCVCVCVGAVVPGRVDAGGVVGDAFADGDLVGHELLELVDGLGEFAWICVCVCECMCVCVCV